MTTTRTARLTVTTSWSERVKPLIYIAPLQDAYRKVHDQDNEVIFIISSEWKPTVLTQWTPRPTI